MFLRAMMILIALRAIFRTVMVLPAMECRQWKETLGLAHLLKFLVGGLLDRLESFCAWDGYDIRRTTQCRILAVPRETRGKETSQPLDGEYSRKGSQLSVTRIPMGCRGWAWY